ncbi:MAG: SIR2 family protein [Flavobacteriales bacterium]|nr:SIR2 family protein [Flavobacteriales bacterium]MCB9166783.1 SIR2 family protein [Flavobacteriales bacterium]
MTIEEAIDVAYQGEAILFVGAGFSSTAKNKMGNRLPVGAKLSSHLLSRCGLSEQADLGPAAELFLDKFGSTILIKEIKELFTVGEIQECHRNICNIPWKRLYTTNYDNVVEVAHAEHNRKVLSYTTLDSPYTIPKHAPICLHINGYAISAEANSLSSDLKLTSTSYFTPSFQQSPWCEYFKGDIRLAKAVFFVGYSLQYDLDISRILFEYGDLKEKCFFITSENTKETSRSILSKFGEVNSIGVDTFATMVEARRNLPRPSKSNQPTLACFAQVVLSQDLQTVTTPDVFNLLLFGNRNIDFIKQSMFDNPATQYYVRRHQLDQVIECIRSGTAKNVVVHSGMANGKTLFLDGLAVRLIEQSYVVYRLMDVTKSVESEIDWICSRTGPTAIIIENYVNYVYVLEQIQLKRAENIVILLSLRSNLNDIHADRIAGTLQDQNITEVSLDQLADEEIQSLIDLTNSYGLWGSKAGMNEYEKERFLVSECDREFQPYLLSIIESPDVHSRVEVMYEQLAGVSKYEPIVQLILIVEIIGIVTNVDNLTEIVDVGNLNSAEFRRLEIVREFLDFDRGNLKARSSLLAKYLLHNFGKTDDIVDILIRCIKVCSAHYSFEITGPYRSNFYHGLFKSIMRYSILDSLLPNKGKREGIIRFYESVRNYASLFKNIQYWLQNAIARMAFGEYDIAKKNFDTAYALAYENPNYDTSYLDNAFSRWLMESKLASSTDGNSFENFRDAHAIVRSQANSIEGFHYPFRVAGLYLPMYDRFFHRWRPNEKNYFVDACKDLLNILDSRRGEIDGNHYVAKAKLDLESIVSKTARNTTDKDSR